MSKKTNKENAPLVEYPFPLRDGMIIHLRVPTNLKKEEVIRIENFLKTLAMDKDEE